MVKGGQRQCLKICAEKFVGINTRMQTYFACLRFRTIYTKVPPVGKSDNLIEDISGFGSISSLDALLYEQFNTSSKTWYRHTTKRRATRMDGIVSCLDKTLTNTTLDHPVDGTNLLQAFLMRSY